MMNRMAPKIVTAITVLIMTAAVSSFAQTDATAGAQGGTGARPMMQKPGCCSQPRQLQPQHLLLMAYHKNVITFAAVLDQAARQGETVPPDLARTAVAEMRRSVDEIEKLRAGQNVPPEMQKMMDQHLVATKTQLRDLETLTKGDRISSQEVLKHTQLLLDHRAGMEHGRGMGMGGGCGGCGGCGSMRDCGSKTMMPEHHQRMGQMQQKIKAQDQELTALVERMNRAPRDKKVDLLADIVSRMVKQKTEFANQMERMQQEQLMQRHMMQHEGAMRPPAPGMIPGDYQESDDGDAEDNEY